MRIDTLVLYRNNRLTLNLFEKIVINYQSDYQLFSGVNGAGKTTIVEESSPLPASKDNYDDGGYKEITITHREHKYILRSTFTHKTQYHEFIMDGTEQNQTHKVTAQRQLVKDHFNYDNTIHQLLVGSTFGKQLTTMTTTKREMWFMELSNIDARYSLGVYGKLKSRCRDTIGTIKSLKARILKEQDKLYPKDKLETLKREASQLMDELSEINDNRVSGIASDNELDQLRESLEHELIGIIDGTKRIHFSKAYLNVTDEALKENSYYLRGEIEASKRQLTEIDVQHAEIESSLSETKVYTDEEINAIMQQQHDNRKTLNAFKKRLGDPINEPDKTLSDYNNVARLGCGLDTLPENPLIETGRYKYNRRDEQAAKETIEENTERLNALTSRISTLSKQLTHYHEASTTSCPSCGYEWVEGFTDKEVEEINVTRDKLCNERDTLKDTIDKANDYLYAYNEWVSAFTRYRYIANDHPRLSILWEQFKQDGQIYTSPSECFRAFIEYESVLIDYVSYTQSIEKDEYYTAILSNDHSKDGDHLDMLKQQLERLDSRFTDINETIEDKGKQLTALSTELAVRGRYNQLCDRLTGLCDGLHKYFSHTLYAVNNRYLKTQSDDKLSRVATINESLQDQRGVEGIIANLSDMVTDNQLDHEAYTLLLEVLSPVDGLIAEQMSGFMRELVDQMNDVIAQCCSYPLIINPCDMDGGEMDYQFGMEVGDSHRLISDVSEGSTGQRELVDFAFKLSAMLCKDMTDYPLYLDELGHSLSPEHRVAIVQFIKYLVEAGRCSQVFFISHHPEVYHIYSSADRICLDPDKITGGNGVNRYVTVS